MAIYLYCVRKSPHRRPADEAGINPALIRAVKTIDEGEAYVVPYKELEAVVSPVDSKEFGSEEIQKKAQEDVNWIKEKAQIHEHVIEQAMGLSADKAGEAGLGKIVPVIPMKFGTIFKTKQSLEGILEKNYLKFKKLLEDLEGKQEWGVKVYLNEKVFTKHFKTPRTVTRRGSSEVEELASLPKGLDYFVKKQAEEVIKQVKNRRLEKLVGKIFENLQKLAVEASQGKDLDKALTGRKEPMVLNLNLLIKEEKVEEFQKEVNGLKKRYQNQGLIIQESGPWPPFNFVEIGSDQRERPTLPSYEQN